MWYVRPESYFPQCNLLCPNPDIAGSVGCFAVGNGVRSRMRKATQVMTKSNHVSVITPAYNAGDVIGQTIESLLAQTHADWEQIVIDDCSTDNTAEVVNAHSRKDPRIRLISLDRNRGAPAGPRNIGIAHARGPWVAFLDSDDLWHPRKLEYQLDVLQETGAQMCSTAMSDFSDSDDVTFDDPGQVPNVEITFAKQQWKGRIPTSSVILAKSLAEQYAFNEDLRYKAVEDYHCWLRVHAEIGHSIKIDYPFLRYRVISGQISGSKLYMLGRMFVVHREYPDGNLIKASLYTLTHALGALYFRFLQKSL